MASRLQVLVADGKLVPRRSDDDCAALNLHFAISNIKQSEPQILAPMWN